VEVISEKQEDGTVPEPEGLPEPCERCGEVPEKVLHIIEEVVPSPAGSRAQGLAAGESVAEVIGGPRW
jgi:hypothetical protein